MRLVTPCERQAAPGAPNDRGAGPPTSKLSRKESDAPSSGRAGLAFKTVSGVPALYALPQLRAAKQDGARSGSQSECGRDISFMQASLRIPTERLSDISSSRTSEARELASGSLDRRLTVFPTNDRREMHLRKQILLDVRQKGIGANLTLSIEGLVGAGCERRQHRCGA
jgi:hypothetical protein